jgi:hypothetical protein
MRTKESKPVRKPTKQGGRNAGKRAKPKSQRADAAGVPTPTPRPDPTTGQPPPIPTPRPGKPEMYTGDFSGPSDVRVAGGKQGRPQPGARPAPYTGDWSGPSNVQVAGGKGPRGPEIGATSPSQLPQGGVVDQSVRRGAPGQVTPSGRTGRLPQNPGAPNVATRQVGPAVPGQSGPPARPVTAPPQTNYLKAGMSTIADLLDMLSPEDMVRPIEDLQQLDIQPPMTSGGPGFRRGGAIPDDGR